MKLQREIHDFQNRETEKYGNQSRRIRKNKKDGAGEDQEQFFQTDGNYEIWDSQRTRTTVVYLMIKLLRGVARVGEPRGRKKCGREPRNNCAGE